MVGELGFYLGIPRTTSVMTEQPTTCWRLSRDALQAMKMHAPEGAAAFYELTIHAFAERLANTSKTVEVLLQ